MKQGLCVVNSYNKSRGYLYQSERLKSSFKSFDVNLSIQRTEELELFIDKDGSINTRQDLSIYDFVVFYDKDTVISRMLEKKGLKVFNSSIAIDLCDNKFLTHTTLANNNIKMPKTYPSFLCYSQNNYANYDYFLKISKELGFPLVVKINYGSLGANVKLINDLEELIKFAEQNKNNSFLIQEFIKESYGKDIRVIVIKNKVVTSMLRKNELDFRSNISLGGKGYRIDLPKEAEQIAIKASKILKLDYCGVDILIGDRDYYLCEVNSNAFFEEIEKVTNVDVAKEYAKYIYGKIYK